MTNEEIILKLKKSGHADLLQDLCIQNEPIIKRLANKYGRGIIENVEDLSQECALALCKAAQVYDNNRDATFLSFAIPWMKHACIQYIHRNAPISLPQSRLQLINNYIELRQNGTSEEEIKALLKIRSYKDLEAIQRQASYLLSDHILSLDAPRGENEEGEPCSLSDLLADPKDGISDLLERLDEERLMLRIEALPPMERYIVKARLSDHPVSFGELADRLKLTKSELYKLKRQAYRRLQKEVKTVDLAESAFYSSRTHQFMQGRGTSVTEESAIALYEQYR